MTGLIAVLAREPDGTGTAGLPGPQDFALLESLRELGDLPRDEQVDVRAEIRADESWQLIGWAERACTWAVRSRDTDVLAAAAAAASLHDPDLIDARDAALVLALVSRASTLVGVSISSVLARALDMTDELGGAWLSENLRPDRPLPPTHREVGTGPTFTFERAGADWDPYVTLAHLLDDSPGARMAGPDPGDPPS